MDMQQAIPIIEALTSPENVLMFLGVFSIIAKLTPWQWDDELERKLKRSPKAVTNGVKWGLTIIDVLGLTKKKG